MPERPAVADVSDLVADGRPRPPRRPGGRRGRRSQHLLGGARGRRREPRHRARGGRRAGRPAGDDRDRQPPRARHGLPRRAAGAGGRRPGQPGLRRPRAGPDAGRLRLADGRRRRDRAAARPRGGRDGPRGPGRRGRRRRRRPRRCCPRRSRPVVVPVGEDARRRASWRGSGCRPPRRDRCPRCQDPEKLAVLLYTSGTSGRPRAAMLTHRALLANLDQVARVEPAMLRGDDVVLGVLPLFHVYGLNAVLGAVLRHGATLVLVERFDPEETLARDRGAPLHRRPGRAAGLRLLGRPRRPRRRLAGVRLMLSGSAPLSTELVERFEQAARGRGAPGLRPHRGGARRHQHPGQRAAPGRLGRRRAARRRDPAGRRHRPRARGRRPRRDLDPRRATCSAATGPTAATAPTPTAGGAPATSASSTPAATCSSSTGSRSW